MASRSRVELPSGTGTVVYSGGALPDGGVSWLSRCAIFSAKGVAEPQLD